MNKPIDISNVILRSRRTILKNGGIYDSTVFCEDKNENLERYWIDLVRKGDK